jgi:hypothetical protein
MRPKNCFYDIWGGADALIERVDDFNEASREGAHQQRSTFLAA